MDTANFINIEVQVSYSFSKHNIFSAKAKELFIAVCIIEEICLENWQRVSSTRLSKTLSLLLCIHKDNAKWRSGSSRSLILLLFMRFLWDCMEISVYGSSEVYRTRPDVLGCFACGPVRTFSDAAPCEGLKNNPNTFKAKVRFHAHSQQNTHLGQSCTSSKSSRCHTAPAGFGSCHQRRTSVFCLFWPHLCLQKTIEQFSLSLIKKLHPTNNNNNNNNNHIQRPNLRIFTISSLHRQPSPTRTLKWPRRCHVQISYNTSSACHVQHVVLRATWYEGTAQLSSLTELKLHLFEHYFIGWAINLWRRRKPEFPEKTPGDELQKKPEDSSTKGDSNLHNSIGGRLGKQMC